MSYNHGLEFMKFEARQRRLRKQCERLGMSEADIAALYEADLQEFNSDRRHEEHNPIRLDDCEPLAAPEDRGHCRLWWVEEIDNSVLAKRLKSLPEADLELLTLYAIEGYSQPDIAEMLSVNQSNVSRRLSKLKIFFEIFEKRA